MGNVVGGRPILYVNTPVEQIREITASILASGRAVWVGADDEERQRFYTSAGFAPSGGVRTLGDQAQHMWWAGRD